MTMLNPIVQLGEASGGAASPDYTGSLVALSQYAGAGFGDGLTHYDAEEEATYSGGVLTLQQGSMVAITIPEALRSECCGALLRCEYGAIRPDSNDYLVTWLQHTAGTEDLTGAGALSSYLYRSATTVGGSVASPDLTPSSTSSSHGASPAAGDAFVVGIDVLPGSTVACRASPVYWAAGATNPTSPTNLANAGFLVGGGSPAPERVVVWLRDTVGPVAGATVKVTHLQLLRKRGIWS